MAWDEEEECMGDDVVHTLASVSESVTGLWILEIGMLEVCVRGERTITLVQTASSWEGLLAQFRAMRARQWLGEVRLVGEDAAAQLVSVECALRLLSATENDGAVSAPDHILWREIAYAVLGSVRRVAAHADALSGGVREALARLEGTAADARRLAQEKDGLLQQLRQRNARITTLEETNVHLSKALRAYMAAANVAADADDHDALVGAAPVAVQHGITVPAAGVGLDATTYPRQPSRRQTMVPRGFIP